jgi:type IV secretory pathway TrbL component
METLIDKVVGSFLGAIQAGTLAVAPFGLGGLAILAVIAYGTRQWPLVMSSGAGLGDVLASFLLLVMGLGITLWIVTTIIPMGDALFQAALTIGLQAAGSPVTANQLRSPSFLLSMHKIVTKPLETFILAHTGVAFLFNGPTVISFWLAELAIYITFIGIALHVALIQIEFYLAILTASVLLPCVVLTSSTFLGEWVVGWVLGCTTRVLLISAIAAIGVPLFQSLALAPVGGASADPTWVEALGVVAGSVLFGMLAWFIPGRAANLVGSGLGLSGSLIAGAAASSARGLLLLQNLAQQAQRVISPMLRGR